MLLNKKTLNVANAASMDASRYAINGILIESNGSAVATDGRIMIRYTQSFQADEKEFPVIDGMTLIDENTQAEPLIPFILPSEACQQITKALPKKKSRYLPILLDNIRLDVVQTNKNDCAVMAVTNLENPQIFRPKKIDGQFPDVTKIEPTTKATVEVGVMLEVMEKMVKTLKSLGVERFKLGVRNATDVISIDAKNSDHDTIHGLLMPCRLD